MLPFRPLLSKLSERREIEVFDPHFEEVRGAVEPWLIAHWKARVGLPIRYNIVLFSLSLTVDALQGKTCQNSLLLGGSGSVWARFQGEEVVPWEYFLVSRKLDSLLSDSANCTLLCAVVLTQYRRVTDGRTADFGPEELIKFWKGRIGLVCLLLIDSLAVDWLKGKI